MVYEPIRIRGLADFRRGLRTMDRNLPKQVRLAFNEAGELVVDAASPLVPRVTGKAAASLKMKSTQTSARVAGGSARAPYYPWLDFGGAVGKKHSVKRPFYKHGRYLYRAYDENRPQVLDILQRSIVQLARDAGIEVDTYGN